VMLNRGEGLDERAILDTCLRDANDTPAFTHKALVLCFVSPGCPRLRMPVRTIYFNCHLKERQGKVDQVAPDLVLEAIQPPSPPQFSLNEPFWLRSVPHANLMSDVGRWAGLRTSPAVSAEAGARSPQAAPTVNTVEPRLSPRGGDVCLAAQTPGARWIAAKRLSAFRAQSRFSAARPRTVRISLHRETSISGATLPAVRAAREHFVVR
jgi:hypothetical protein